MSNKPASGYCSNRLSGFNIMAVLFVFCVGVVPSAQAYLDPGSFSFVIQTLIAALVGALFALKNYWIGLKNWFTGKSSEVNPPAAPDQENNDSQKHDENSSR